ARLETGAFAGLGDVSGGCGIGFVRDTEEEFARKIPEGNFWFPGGRVAFGKNCDKSAGADFAPGEISGVGREPNETGVQLALLNRGDLFAWGQIEEMNGSFGRADAKPLEHGWNI